MSTQINIVVDSGGLRDRVRQLQSAGRRGQQEKERTARIEAEATTKRNENLETQGLSPDGVSLYATGFSQADINRRPAANRIGGEGFFAIISNTTAPILYDSDTNTLVFENSFNARSDAQQPYDFYLGPPSIPTSLPPGPEIPVGMTRVGLFDFETYNSPVYYIILDSKLKLNSVLRHIPPEWTMGSSYSSNLLNTKDDNFIPWVMQSLNNTNNIAFVPATAGGEFPFQITYYLISGYIKSTTLYGVRRTVLNNPANIGDRLGNFYGLSPEARIELLKEPATAEWLLPSPPWTTSFDREP